MKHVRALSLTAALALLAMGAWADGVIDILPDGVTTTTIASPGSYRLAGNVTTADPDLTVISITGNSVTLDLGGHVIQGASGGSSLGRGINITGDSARVHGGTVRQFSNANIYMTGVQGAWIHDMRVEDSFSSGLAVQNSSFDCLVERCSVLNNALYGFIVSDFERRLIVRDCQVSGNLKGIWIFADDSQILNCSFSNNSSHGVDIGGAAAANTVVTGNVFTGNGTGVNDSGTGSLVANNLATGNTANYTSVSSVSSQAASNEWGDNLTP